MIRQEFVMMKTISRNFVVKKADKDFFLILVDIYVST